MAFKGTIPPELVESIKNNKCILFVGAGLSAKVKRSNNKNLPLWGEFLNELLEWAKSKNALFWNGDKEISESIKKNNYLLVAQELQECIPLGEFAEFLNYVFRDKNVKPTNTHKNIFKIPFRCILTTNYDSLLEGAYTLTHKGQVPVKIIQEDLRNISSPLRKDDFFIFKIHGDIDRPDSIVLGSRSYNQLLFRSPEYLHFLETLFTTHTVLFVGFNGSDIDLDFVIDRLSTIYSRTLNKHYILLPDTKFNLTEKRRLLLDRRLEVIDYISDVSHSQVDHFFDEIEHLLEENSEINEDEDAIAPDLFIVSSKQFYEEYGKIVSDSLYSLEFWQKKSPKFLAWHHALGENKLNDNDYLFKNLPDSPVAVIFIDKDSMEDKYLDNLYELLALMEADEKAIILPITLGDIELPPFLNRRAIRLFDVSRETIETIFAHFLGGVKL